MMAYKTVMIAKTEKRERSVDFGHFWFEYQVKSISADEWADLRSNRIVSLYESYHPWILENRRVDQPEGTQEQFASYGEWQFWGFNESPDLLIADFMGDSSFERADSLHPIHQLHKDYAKAVREQSAKVSEAKNDLQYALQRGHELATDGNREYRKATEKAAGDAKKLARAEKRIHSKYASNIDMYEQQAEGVREILAVEEGKLSRLREAFPKNTVL